MTFDEIGQLMESGWHIGAHTVTHPNLSQLFLEDPSGEKLRAELEQCGSGGNCVERKSASAGFLIPQGGDIGEPMTRFRSRSKFARPCICRLMSFSRLTGVEIIDEPFALTG